MAPPPRGVLPGRYADGDFEHRRLRPCETLAPFVAHFWWVRWAVSAPVPVETLPHPAVHLTFETPGDEPEVGGVSTRRFSRHLEGSGRVFGVKFRPGAFQPFVGGSMARLTDRRTAIGELFGDEGRVLSGRLRAVATLDEAIDAAEAFLRGRVPSMPADNARVRDLVERIEADRDIVRVEQAAAMAGTDVRTLERRFRRCVGVGPKWVIRRYRLMEAAEQLKAAPSRSLADLAPSLGYFDQPHFARDFKSLVGVTPARFAARARTGS